MTSSPATPVEKLKCLELQARERGKAFNENDAIAYVNAWWKARGGEDVYLLRPVSDPLILEESPDRARQVRMDDLEARREIEEARKRAEQEISDARTKIVTDDFVRMRLEQLEEQLLRLSEENRRLREQAGEPGATEVLPAAAVPPAEAQAAAPVAGMPSMAWTWKQLAAYAAAAGVEGPLDGLTKAELLQEIIVARQALEKADIGGG